MMSDEIQGEEYLSREQEAILQLTQKIIDGIQQSEVVAQS
ncbi:MAG: hypothetical protein S4CHLAM45_04730 [Chlamydiales bacterium]|nr:hypothetical protein [Chlamydiales bacterium]MCH9622587.1 hypothetical protein [Chlamydiales bacterium]